MQYALAQGKNTLSLGEISTSTPRQIVKQVTQSNYLHEAFNDFDLDGQQEHIIGANCVEGFCENYIFRSLSNKRVQFIGKASFHHKVYELVWPPQSSASESKHSMADIIFFRQQNVGQGCLGRYQFIPKNGYTLVSETCRLPKEVLEVLSSYKEPEKPVVERRSILANPDVIDLSDIE